MTQTTLQTPEDITKIESPFDYLTIIHSNNTKIRFSYFSVYLSVSFSFDLYFFLDLGLELDLYFSLSPSLERYLDHYLDHYLDQRLDELLKKLPSPLFLLKKEIQSLRQQRPDPKNEKQFKQWWKVNGKDWTEKLRAIMIRHRNIGHDWQFSKEQKELLKKYYEANILLIQCLGRDCVINRPVREEIERTLFLPSPQSAIN